eukprot:comp25125_c0_seq1/m.46958 comp25125_c0_seq1/g.46958  ORF comp25125_c0_seq1/g.46958 comp25125_c0_seq1/m.46958 type:complete len:211 (-) comp25125_c0_seq1:213-845(-)
MNDADESVANEDWRIWRARKTLFQMCHDRGYLVAAEELNMSLSEFRNRFPGAATARSSLTICVSNKNDQADKLFVFFPEERKIGVAPIKQYFEKMQAESVYRSIIVVIDGISPMAKGQLNKVPKYTMEMFLESELLVNIMEHELVPKHIILTEEEKKEVLNRYKLKDSQLPRMQKSDPVARYFGLNRGQLVKIVRPSETAGRYTTYRLVM